jgi:peptidoglycan-associated lipoprotein
MRVRGSAWVVSIAAGPLLLFGCARKPVTPLATAPAPSTLAATRGSGPGASPGTSALTRSSAVERRPSPSEFSPTSALTDIHFDFDLSDIRPQDAKILEKDGAWMNEHPRALILVEGQTDERGTDEYNLALGERRAEATKNFLMSRGVQAPRINVISYGEERPVCIAHSEACWAKNRRAHFLVKLG